MRIVDYEEFSQHVQELGRASNFATGSVLIVTKTRTFSELLAWLQNNRVTVERVDLSKVFPKGIPIMTSDELAVGIVEIVDAEHVVRRRYYLDSNGRLLKMETP